MTEKDPFGSERAWELLFGSPSEPLRQHSEGGEARNVEPRSFERQSVADASSVNSSPSTEDVEKEISIEETVVLTQVEAETGGPREVTVRTPDGEKRFRVRIPQQVKTGTTLRLRQKQIVVTIRIEVLPHASMLLEDGHLAMRLPITIEEAVCGASISVQTVRSNKLIEITSGDGITVPIVLAGEGLVHMLDPKLHDLRLYFYIQPPDVITTTVQEAARAITSYYSVIPRRK